MTILGRHGKPVSVGNKCRLKVTAGKNDVILGQPTPLEMAF